MREPEQTSWHEKTLVRILALLLLPFIALGIYFISTNIMLNRPTPIPLENNEDTG